MGIERSYKTFTEAAKEGGKSRIYAGIHWSFDVAIGEKVGRMVGQYVASASMTTRSRRIKTTITSFETTRRPPQFRDPGDDLQSLG